MKNGLSGVGAPLLAWNSPHARSPCLLLARARSHEGFAAWRAPNHYSGGPDGRGMARVAFAVRVEKAQDMRPPLVMKLLHLGFNAANNVKFATIRGWYPASETRGGSCSLGLHRRASLYTEHM
jgi:hypothetical protein